jgi:hypothetical protein
MGKTTKVPTPPSYVDRLVKELNQIETEMLGVVRDSTVINTDPNRYGDGIFFVGHADWGWGPSDAAHEAARMSLTPALAGWFVRFRLLFPHPTPRVADQLEKARKLLGSWLLRDRGSNDHSVPSSVNEALKIAESHFSDLRGLVQLLPEDDHPTRVLIDTNALIDC